MEKLRNNFAIKMLAKNLKKYRLQKGLTMQALANKANMEYSQISRIEREVINTSVSVIFEIAAALEIEPEELLSKKDNI